MNALKSLSLALAVITTVAFNSAYAATGDVSGSGGSLFGTPAAIPAAASPQTAKITMQAPMLMNVGATQSVSVQFDPSGNPVDLIWFGGQISDGTIADITITPDLALIDAGWTVFDSGTVAGNVFTFKAAKTGSSGQAISTPATIATINITAKSAGQLVITPMVGMSDTDTNAFTNNGTTPVLASADSLSIQISGSADAAVATPVVDTAASQPATSAVPASGPAENMAFLIVVLGALAYLWKGKFNV